MSWAPAPLFALEAIGMRQDAQNQKAELKARSRQELQAGKDRELARKETLLDEIARRNAMMGAGIGTQAPIDREVRDAQDDLTSIRATTEARRASLRRQGKAAHRRGNFQAAGSLAKTASLFAGGGGA